MRVLLMSTTALWLIACVNSSQQRGPDPLEATPNAFEPPTKSGKLFNDRPRLAACEFEPIRPKIAPPNVNYPIILVGVAPKYPRNAWKQKLEGWAHLQFDVLADGTVDNVSVLAAEPNGAFGKEAAAVLPKWKFMPWRVKGKSYPQPNSEIVIPFRLCPDGSD